MNNKEEYIKNAGVVGNVPSIEDWGMSNGKLMDVKVGLSKEQIQQLQDSAKQEGISVEEYLQRLIARG